MSKEKLVERHGEIVCCPQNVECTLICDDCDHMGEMMYKLAEYEDLEEQGLLLRLPNRAVLESIGDTVYYIYDFEIVECINCGVGIDFEGNICIALACDEDIFPYRNPDPEHDLDPTEWCKNSTDVKVEEWNKTVFLTQTEAEEKLRELEEK